MVKTDKNFYDRKIVYLDYLERGAKVKNGGFVKWEARGETSRIQIHIRGLYPTDTLRGEIQLISREDVHTADNVKIDFGSGEYVGVWKNEDLAGTTVSFEECDGVQVKLSENRLLIGQWRKREALQEKQPENTLTVPNAALENQPEDLSEISKTRREIGEVRDEREESALVDAEGHLTETAEVEAESAVGAEEEVPWDEEVSAEGKNGEREQESREREQKNRETEHESGVLEQKSRETEQESGELEQESRVWEPKGGVREQEDAIRAPAEIKEEEAKRRNEPEVSAEEEGRKPEQESAWEASAEIREKEAKRRNEPEASAEEEERKPKQESAREASAEIKEKEAKRGNEPKVSAGEEGRAPEWKSASESSVRMKEAEKASDERKERAPEQESVWRTTGGMGKPERKKETENKSMGRNPQCRELLSGDKWEQLNKQYPHIHPFGDAREYLSITPRDFVILSRKYQELVQNSFLLHGYYNYGHVILTRIKEKSGERFYLGVPGVYYTREKQAALMFGFEGFEAGTEQAVDGGFGYYMKQVDI